MAQHADWIFCLVRTDSSGIKQQGISFLLIDMKTPGVEVKPIITIDGSHEVNMVYLDNVEVPAENLIGEEGAGWSIAKFLLAHERTGIGGIPHLKREIRRLRQITEELPLNEGFLKDDQLFMDKLNKVEIDLLSAEYTELRTLASISAGGHPGPESSILKIGGTDLQQSLSDLYVEALGYYAHPFMSEDDLKSNEKRIGPDFAANVMPHYLNYRKVSIYGGSNEVQRCYCKSCIRPLKNSVTDYGFPITDEQKQLQDLIHQFIQKDYPFDVRDKLVKSEDGFSKEFWKTFSQFGLLAMPFSEEDGGFNGGPVDIMIILEAFGTGLIVEPYIPNIVLSGNLVSKLGNKEQKEAILPNLLSGDMQLAFAFSEPQSRFDLNDVTTLAEKKGSDFKLNGFKSVVMNGPAADKLIISARTAGSQLDENGISLFIVDRETKGVSLRDYSNIDGSKASELTLEDVVLTEDALLGEQDKAFSTIEEVVNLATLAISAEAIGIMQKMNELTLEYTKTREQFGQALSQFQALQHRMVDTFMVHEQTKSLLLMAAAKMNDKADDAVKAISALKYQVGNAAKLIGEESIQLHGGMGVTEEMSIGHYFKRLTTIRTIFGNADYHLKKYSSL